MAIKNTLEKNSVQKCSHRGPAAAAARTAAPSGVSFSHVFEFQGSSVGADGTVSRSHSRFNVRLIE